MRYDSQDHLTAWIEHRTFPKIHDAIAEMAIAEMQGSRVLDLGCSYGLLGGRLVKQAGARFAVGVDLDERAMTLASVAGVPVEFRKLAITAATLPAMLDLVREYRLDVLVARRILPELFGDDLPLGVAFAEQLASAGIREVFLEGRVETLKAVNVLCSIEQEVALFTHAICFEEVRRVRAVSYLRRR